MSDKHQVIIAVEAQTGSAEIRTWFPVYEFCKDKRYAPLQWYRWKQVRHKVNIIAFIFGQILLENEVPFIPRTIIDFPQESLRH